MEKIFYGVVIMNKYIDAIEKIKANCTDLNEELDKLYELVEKNNAKQVIEMKDYYKCPTCDHLLSMKYDGMCISCLYERHYCPTCGQCLDWCVLDKYV